MGNIRFLFCLKNYRGIYYIIMVFLIAKEQTPKIAKGENEARSVQKYVSTSPQPDNNKRQADAEQTPKIAKGEHA